MRDQTTDVNSIELAPGFFSEPVRAWFDSAFPNGPTSAQRQAWPAIARGENVLIVSPTGTGKTLAAFLAIIDRRVAEIERDARESRKQEQGVRCVYVSPLKSLVNDVERNLNVPLRTIAGDGRVDRSFLTVGVRTGDTTAHFRRKLRDRPPDLLVTTPESLSLLLSQKTWRDHWRTVEHLIVDEIHSLAPNKRGADLAVSIERLARFARNDPARIGLSATCGSIETVKEYLTGVGRACRVVEAERDRPPASIEIEMLLKSDEAPHRGLTYRRLLKSLNRAIDRERTTLIFAETRAFAERITHDLRKNRDDDRAETIAAHHSALDARRRLAVEASLKAGDLRAAVTSTSLELGIDIGTADLAVLVGVPGSVSRCLQRLGRSGHRPGATTRGLLVAADPAELIVAAVLGRQAREGRLESLRTIDNPLDVLCQQLIGLACEGEQSADEAFGLIRRTWPFRNLKRDDYDACLGFLAGESASPPGAFEPEPGASPKWTSPRLWKHGGFFGLRNGRIRRLFWRNVGTIVSEESARVEADGVAIGTLEASYAERLQRGDRFVLDGRALEFRRLDGLVVHARPTGGEPTLPRWSSDRRSLSSELARAVAEFREEAARLLEDDPLVLRARLQDEYELDADAAESVARLLLAQQRESEVPRGDRLLVETSPSLRGFAYTFHAPLGRSACEALGRAIAARIGRRFGRDLSLVVADLGWSIVCDDELPGGLESIPDLFSAERFVDDLIEGLDRGELAARRFRHVATTSLMVSRHPEGGRLRVGGLLWVSARLYPLVKAACPDHPLLVETRREVLEDLLDAPSALAWLETRPTVRLRELAAPSPFATSWIDPSSAEPLRFEPPDAALKRLHARLISQGPDR